MAKSNTVEFDPDAYLAQANKPADSGFDPDAYLGSAGGVAVAPQPETSLWSTDVPVPTGWGGTMNVNPVQVAQTVKNVGLEGGGAVAGQSIGAMGGPLSPATIPLGGFIGGAGGNIIGQLTTPGKDFSLGEALAAGTAGAIPGAPLAKAGASALVKQAGKMALGNIAATNVESMVEGKGPASFGQDVKAGLTGAGGTVLGKYLDRGIGAATAIGNKSKDSFRRETIKLGRDIGLTVPPAVTRPGPLNNTLQSIGGKAAVAQETIIRNQPKVNAAVRAEIGLPPDAPLSPIALNTARVAPNAVYAEVAGLTPATGGLLDNFKKATADAKLARQRYQDSIDSGKRNPAHLVDAEAADTVAEKMRDAIAAEAKSVNATGLIKRFDEARVRLSQIGLAERAVNKGSGDIDPAVIGRAFDHGEKLTGAFSTIGRFENAFGKYLRDAATTPPSGVDYLKMLGKFGVGTGLGYAAGGYTGAFIGGIGTQVAEKGARSLAVNPAYQRAFASPFYGAALEDAPASVIRLGTAAEGRKNRKPKQPSNN